MRLDHLLSKENCVGQTRGSAIGEGTEVVVQFSVRDSSLKEKRDPRSGKRPGDRKYRGTGV